MGDVSPSSPHLYRTYSVASAYEVLSKDGQFSPAAPHLYRTYSVASADDVLGKARQQDGGRSSVVSASREFRPWVRYSGGVG